MNDLKQKFSETWLKLCVNLHQRLPEDKPDYLYWLLGATVFGEVANAPNYTAAVVALGKVLGDLGIEAISNVLEEFRQRKGEAERMRLLQAAAQDSEAVRQTLDLLLQKLNALPAAQAVFNASHSDPQEQKWFADAMRLALQRAGSRLRIKTGKGSALAVGKKAKAQTRRVTAKGKNAKAIDRSVNIQAENLALQINKETRSRAATNATKELQRRYLEKLQTDCNLLLLAALAKESDPHANLRLTLDKVYVGLNTTLLVDKKGKLVVRDLSASDEARKETRPLTVLEAALHESQLVVLGDPGSGKSSFINHLLWQLAERRLRSDSAELSDWPYRKLFPIRVLLREFLAVLQSQNAHGFLALSQQECRRQFCRAVHKHLHDMLAKDGLGDFAPALEAEIVGGRSLIVFDGLDEAPPELRSLLRHAVECFCAQYSRNRFLVTCRILSYEKEAVLPSFNNVILAPFDLQQIDAFITLWYRALQQLGKPREWTEAKIKDLQQAVRAIDRLPRSMVSNPLLLTTLASVHANNVELPRQRVRLYQQAAGLLLKRWQEAKAGKVSLFEEIGLTEENKMLHALWELGHFGQDAGKAQDSAFDVPRKNALEILEKNFAGVREPEIAAIRFLDYVDQSAGLLNGRGGLGERVYAFPHRTFQEYFAGCYLAKRTRAFKREVKRLLPHGDYWRLAAQLGIEEILHNDGNEYSALEVAYHLCPAEAEPTEETGWRGVLWAGHFAMAIGAASIEKDLEGDGQYILQHLRHRLAKILEQGLLPARERADAGFVLGRLGDPRPDVCTLPLVWVELPGGKFVLGSNDGEEREKPPHEVELSPFKISKYPITKAQFEIFMDDGGYQNEKWWSKDLWKDRKDRKWEERSRWRHENFDLPNQPVVGMSWFEAEAFCNWLTEQMASGKSAILQVRLPTEAEWEFAARGSAGREFPWGKDEPTPEHANYGKLINRPTAVGSYVKGATPEGVFDLAGNVWEWCQDWYGEKYYVECKKQGVVKDPTGPEIGGLRIIRGGSCYSDATGLRGTLRYRLDPDRGLHDLGFRVVVGRRVLKIW